MNTSGRVTITVTHDFKAPAEQVFDAWLDQGTVGRWLFATPTGTMVCTEIDGRVGGSFSIVEKRDGEEILHAGRYLALDRPRLLTFLFSVPKFSAEETQVKVQIEPTDLGCRVTLTHEGVYEEYASRTEAGWKMILGNLEKTL